MFCNNISNSKRETFRQCRLKYRYNYVDRFEETDKGNADALHFGSFIHEIFEHNTHATTLEQLLEYGKSIRDKYEFGPAKEKLIEKCCRNFLRFNASLPKESIQEHHFSENLGSDIKHEGYIDRIVKAPTGDVLVIDYKTSKREKKPFELVGDPQGKSYVYAAHKLTGVPIRKITFIHYYPVTNNVVHARYTEQAIAAHVKNVVEDVWKIRKAKKDDLTPTENEWCRWCGYRSICPLFNEIADVQKRLDECKKRPPRKR